MGAGAVAFTYLRSNCCNWLGANHFTRLNEFKRSAISLNYLLNPRVVESVTNLTQVHIVSCKALLWLYRSHKIHHIANF